MCWVHVNSNAIISSWGYICLIQTASSTEESSSLTNNSTSRITFLRYVFYDALLDEALFTCYDQVINNVTIISIIYKDPSARCY